jgi:hypothetical protein
MEVIILVSLDLLFLILLACCAALDKRLTRLENAAGKTEEALAAKIEECRRDLDRLKQGEGPAKEEAAETDGTERLKAKLADKRVTDGIASILSYDSDTGRRAAHAERK